MLFDTVLDLGDNKTVGYNITEYIFYLLKNNSVQNRASYVLFTHYSSNVSLVPTSDISRIASGIGIEKTLRSSKNQNDGSGIGSFRFRFRRASDSECDSVVRLLTLPTPTSLPISSLVETRPYTNIQRLRDV